MIINNIDFNMIINNIDFYIKNIEIEQHYANLGNTRLPMNKTIKIIAETSTGNFKMLEDWIDNLMSSNRAYKQDVVYNSIEIRGIFPVDYNFTSHNILVTLSADYIRGDISLFKLQELRRRKLKQINKGVN